MFASVWVRLALDFTVPALLPLPQNNAACIDRQDALKAFGVDYPRPDNGVRGLRGAHLTVRVPLGSRPMMSCQGCSLCAVHSSALMPAACLPAVALQMQRTGACHAGGGVPAWGWPAHCLTRGAFALANPPPAVC